MFGENSNFSKFSIHCSKNKFGSSVIDGECILCQKAPFDGSIYVNVGSDSVRLELVVFALFHSSKNDLISIAVNKRSVRKSCGKASCLIPEHFMKTSKRPAQAKTALPVLTVHPSCTVEAMIQKFANIASGEMKLIMHLVGAASFLGTMNFHAITLQETFDVEVRLGKAPAKFVGLNNYGNNCFANCVLQTIFVLPELKNFLLQSEIDVLKSPTSKELQKVVQCLENRSTNANANDLIDCFAWATREQQDAGEFFEALMEKIEQELSNEYRRLDETLFDIITMNGQSRSLNVSTLGSPGLSASLLDMKQEIFITLPEVLWINLHRFDDHGTKSTKPFSFEELSDFGSVLTGDKKNYELKSVIVHRGGASFGHYKVLVKRETWYEFNDEKVSVVGEIQISEYFGDNSPHKFMASNLIYVHMK